MAHTQQDMDKKTSACRYYATAADFYRSLHSAVDGCEDVQVAYRVFNKVLCQAVNQKVEF